jgi:PAS domain-containing protein
MRLEAAVNLAVTDGTSYEVDLEICWPDGQVASLRGTIQDISERKRTEYERLEAHQRLEALVKALPVGVSISDDATTAARKRKGMGPFSPSSCR